MRLLAAAMAVAALSRAVLAQQCTNGVDYPNDDIRGMPLALTDTDPVICATMCQAEPSCALYVYDPPGCTEPATGMPACYLKYAVPPSTSKPCRCSGTPSRPATPAPPQDKTAYTLNNGLLTATFGAQGLTGMSTVDAVTGAQLSVGVELDTAVLAVDDHLFNTSTLPAPAVTQAADGTGITYTYTAQPSGSAIVYTMNVSYSLQSGWRFVRKQLSVVSSTPALALSIISASPFDTLRLVTASAIVGALYPSGDMGTYGVFARFADGSGVLAAAENPFLYPLAEAVSSLYSPNANVTLVHVGYHPSMMWNQTTPQNAVPMPYEADAGLLSLYSLLPQSVPPSVADLGPKKRVVATGAPLPRQRITSRTDTYTGMTFEYAQLSYTVAAGDNTWMNAAERDAFRAAAGALHQLPPALTNKIHIPWTENDYQVDISNVTQWAEYVRIMSRVKDLGLTHILYAASNSEVATRANNTDSWGWEQTLFLNEGQRIREGYYVPGVDPLPPTLAQLIEVAASFGVKFSPYIYPILGFTADPDWLFPVGNGIYHSRLANRALQDYLVSTIVAFANATGGVVQGAGFDYTFLEDQNATQYAQWFGWRRVLRGIRTALGSDPTKPFIVDNRQLNHMWSPWMWTAGSYAEPLQTDEGPYSWPAYLLDPHTDRQSANRQREMSYDYTQSKLCPAIANPGFMQHQSDRFTPDGNLPVTDLNVRDYDYMGASYAVISAIGSGGMNAVVCGLPARDEGEYLAFPQTAPPTDISISFYKNWFAWADANMAYLQQTVALPVPPSAGVIDGTRAVVNNTGYIFLYNPNAAAMTTPAGLLLADYSLGLICSAKDQFVIGQLWPVQSPAMTVVPCGSNFSVTLEGRSANVFTIAPVSSATAAAVQDGSYGIRAYGRAVRAETQISVAAAATGGLAVSVEGWADVTDEAAAIPACGAVRPAPLYLVVSDAVVSSIKSVTSQGKQLEFVRVDDALRAALSAPATGACLHPIRTTPPPAAAPGTTVLAVSLRVAGPVFVHSQPVLGMAYNSSFAGGTLSGTVLVPQGVFDQLAARNASYPVPWNPEDYAIAWLVPGRLIVYLDGGKALAPGLTLPATLNGVQIPVQPVWSCRSLQRSDCFSGYFIDLSAAGVQPNVSYNLAINLPSMTAGAFGGVYYDNVNTVYSSTLA